MNPFVLLTGETATTGNSTMIIMLVAMFAVFYFLIIRPENKKKKEKEEMLSSINVGDELTTIGGIIGKVVQSTEDTITIETGEDRVRIQLKKWCVSTTKKMEEAEAAKAAKASSTGLFGRKKK